MRIFGNALFWIGRQAIPLLLGGLARLMFNPLTLGIVTTGILIYKYWQPLKAFFSDFFTGIMNGLEPLGIAFSNAFSPAIDIINIAISGIGQLVSWFFNLLSPVQLSSAEFGNWANAGQLAGEVLGKAFTLLMWPLTRVLELIGKVFSGYKMLIEGIGSFFSESDTPKLELNKQTKTEVMAKLLPSLPKQPDTFSEDMAQRLSATNKSNSILAQQSLNPVAQNNHTIHMTQNITISPQAASTPEQIKQAMAMSQRDFEKMLDRYFADRERRAF